MLNTGHRFPSLGGASLCVTDVPLLEQPTQQLERVNLNKQVQEFREALAGGLWS